MLSQVANLGSKYNRWVASPVDRQLRLFENPIFERLTITPWYVVPIVWVPIITALIYIGIFKYTTSKESKQKKILVIHYHDGRNNSVGMSISVSRMCAKIFNYNLRYSL